MTTSALFLASLLVGQTAPPLEQPPVYRLGPAPAEQRQYEAAPDAGPASVVAAGLGVPVQSAPRQVEDQSLPPFAANRSPALAPAAPLAITGPDDEPAPHRSFEMPSARGRTIHTVEPGALAAARQASTSSNLAGALLDRALTPPRERALSGRPLTLTEALSSASASRSEVVRRYWECTVKMAEYHSALDEYARLAAMALPQAGDGRGLLAAAQAAAKAEADEAELLATSAQYDLAEALSSSFASEPPLPTETPLVAAYRTQFDALFGDRSAPAGLKRIHETLPLLHRSLHSRAEAVVAAEDTAGTQDEGYRRGSVELNHVLAAHATVCEERRSFFRTVLEYNTRVAQYAVAVAGSESPNTLVTTMVENPALSATSAARSVLVRNNGTVTPTVTAEPLVASERATLGAPAWQNRDQMAPTMRAPTREAQIPGFNGGQWK